MTLHGAATVSTKTAAVPAAEPSAAEPASGAPVGRVAEAVPAAAPASAVRPPSPLPLGPGLLLRNARMYLVGLVATAYYCIGINVHYTLRTRSRKRFAESVPPRWGKLILRLANVQAEWENPERLGGGRAQILVANHQSWFDVFALSGTLPVKFSFVGKKELSNLPVFGTAWARVGHYGIDRTHSRAAMASLRQVGDRVRSDATTVVMFPEGTRSATGKLARFKKGAFVLAIDAQVPVVPVAVLGTRRIMAKGRWLARPGRITIRVAPPISTKGMKTADRDALARRAREAVSAMMEQGTACPRS